MGKFFEYLDQREFRHRLMTGICVFMGVGTVIVSSIVLAALYLRH